MKKTIHTTPRLCGLILWLSTFMVSAVLAQGSNENISVLKMIGGHGHITHFDTNIGLKTMLLNVGQPGQGTIEFWAKFQNDSQSLWLTSDAFFDLGFTIKMFSNQIILNNKNGSDIQAINADHTLLEQSWQHFAYIFYQTNTLNHYNIDAYADGVKVKTFTNIEIAADSDLYFTKGDPNDEILLTEIKAWNVQRTEDQIAIGRYTTFYQYTGSAIEDQVSQGLAANYSGSAEHVPLDQYLPELAITHWNNTVQKNGYPAYGSTVSRVTNDKIDKQLAVINDTFGNPINELNQIIVRASKGEYDNRIVVNWFHVEELSNYKIFRDNIEIHTKNNINGASGESLFFEDKDALPGTIYTYKVEGVNSDNIGKIVGVDTGFIFPNGELSGNIKTQSNIFVDGAGVAIELANNGINGSALSFAANSDNITFLDQSVFTDNNEITIEFWYKNEVNAATGYNTVFKLGSTEIRMGYGNAMITYNNGDVSSTFGVSAPDSHWHHYAFTLAVNGVKVYRDQLALGSNSTPFEWSSTSSDYNYYLNYIANYAYSLDEFRVWKGKKTLLEIQKHGPYVVGADEEDLLVAYSMDLQGTDEIYNHALLTKGRNTGKSVSNLMYTTQPASLQYVAFTDPTGNYRFKGVYSTSLNEDSYVATAFKPNHEFRPPSVGVTIKQSTIVTDYSKVANFTDISELPVSGRIFYKVGQDIHPVPVGRRIAIDGLPVFGTDDDGLTSDISGVYSISSSLGLHDFEVHNPELDNNLTLSTLSFATSDQVPEGAGEGIVSAGYASSYRKVNYQNTGITLSGFVKPFVSVTNPDFIPEKQTLLKWGEFKIVLKDNTILQFQYRTKVEKEITITNVNEFTFFAISVAPSGDYGFIVGENYKNGKVTMANFIDDTLYLGADIINQAVEEDNLSSLALIQFRHKNYDESQLLAIKNGEIIPNDEKILGLSFEFDQEKGNRALSKTEDGKNNYLILHKDIKTNPAQVFNYTRKYKYEYKAVNPVYNPEVSGINYRLNVIDPLTNVDFEMKDRYGFMGNIVVPCDYNMGEWSGVIERTDGSIVFKKTITSRNFNNDQNIFLVTDLLPGHYQVTLFNINDASVQLSSPIIDLTKGWKSYDFEYRAGLSVEINMYRVKEEKSTLPLSELVEEDFDKLQKLCDNDFYVIDQGNSVLMQVEVYEEYDDQRCVVSNADVTFAGDLLRLPSGSGSIRTQTDENGHAVLTSFVGTPNFTAPYMRNFTIRVAHDNRNFTEKVTGLIEGARMNESDFTIADPVVNWVLHDPPGDGSSVTLKKGTTSISTSTWNISLGYTGTVSSRAGSGVEHDVVATVFGIGSSVTIVEADVTGGADARMSLLGTYNGSTSRSITTSTDISTSSSDNLVGREADLFIGTGYLITVGSGETIAYDQTNCTVSYSNDSPVIDNRIDNSFVHSYFDVKKNIIPNLFISIANEQDVNKIQSYQNSVQQWIRTLVRNDMVLNLYKKSDYKYMLDHPFLSDMYNELPDELNTIEYNWDNYPLFHDFEKNRSFDGGGGTFTQSITTENTSSNGANVQSELDVGFATEYKATIAAVTSQLEYSHTINTKFGGSSDRTTEDDTVIEHTLTDDDAGDRYALEIRRDPDFGIPIYKTLAGQSSCPAERGTQIRTGVEIEAKRNSADGVTGQTLKYNVMLRNTQIAGNTDAPKTYTVFLSQETNPLGAVVKINGTSLNSGKEVPFWFGPDDSSPTGIKQEYEALIEISVPSTETNSSIEYKDLEILFFVPCEYHEDLDFDHNADVYSDAGIKSIDALYLTALFQGPCVDNMKQLSPQENWVVNAANNNVLDFAFTIPGTTVENDVVTLPESLTAIDIEYALVENNTPILLHTIDVEELKTLYQDNVFNLPLDISGLTDGEYGFRLVPVCGIGSEKWRRNNPTPYAYGHISRNAPVLVETNPENGEILEEGVITATYSGQLDPTTLNSLNIGLRGVLGGLPKELVSVDFNLVTDQITIPHGDFLNLSGAYTVEFWINPNNYPSNTNANVFTKGSNYGIQIQPDGKLNCLNDQIGGVTTVSIPLQEWTHVTVIYDGASTLNVYFNGVLVYSNTGYNNTGETLVTNTEDLIIGATSDNDGFVGKLDELRIWDTVRSHADIVSYKNRQLLGNEANLKAYYVFDNIALEIEGHQEAVRDFTGNTRGSFHTGVSWIQGDQAAPLLQEQLVADIPISITSNIDNNVVIISPINFQEYYLEGAKLTAVFSENNIKGVDGNVVAGHSWSFTINKNNVNWGKANITASQRLGTSINLEATLSNNGGEDTTYELQSLPEWLKCTTTNIGSSMDLPGGFENTLQFETSAYLNKGTYYTNIGVITYDSDRIQTGYEYFELELDVDCDVPAYPLNTSSFTHKKEFTAQLTVAGEVSQDSNDRVVAYFNDEIRGVGQVTNINNQTVVLLDVFYNTGELGEVIFRVWDDSQCKEYIGLTQIYQIGDNSSEGTTIDPVTFETGDVVVKRIPLLQGYQWVSFNAITNDLASSLQISGIKGMTSDDEVIELGSNRSVTFDSDGEPVGNLEVIDYTKGYLVKSTSNKLMLLQGVEASMKVDIPITGGFVDNYVGYIPNVMFTSSYALRSLSNKFILGDRISGREGFSEFTEEGWKGTLTHLIPNKAYNIRMHNPGTLNYSGIVGSTEMVRLASKRITFDDIHPSENSEMLEVTHLRNSAKLGVEVDQFKYPHTMSLTAKLTSDFFDKSKTYTIAALYKGQYRGIAKAVPQGDSWVYFMTVYGNNQENISFKLFVDDQAYNIDNQLIYRANSFVGNIENPFDLYISNKLSKSNKVLSISKNPITDKTIITVTPNQSDQYELNLFDKKGTKVAVLFTGEIREGNLKIIGLDRVAGNYLKYLNSGVYICVLKGAKHTKHTLKIVLK